MHSKQHGFTTHCVWVSFSKCKETTQKCKEIGDWRYIYLEKLEKACF